MAAHHEIEHLHDIAREMLLDYREELEAKWKAGDQNSDLKKVREQLSNLDLDPWSYGDILDDALSKGADANNIMKVLRNHQTRTMKLWEVISSDTIHHIIGKRTGGDSLAHVDGKMLREAVEILIDKYGHRFANDPSNYLSLADYAHKGQFGKGLEKVWGVKNTEHRDWMAHFGGNTQSHAKNLTPRDMQDVSSVVEALERLMQPQEVSAQNASILDAGRQNKVNQIVGLEGYGAGSIEKIQKFKKMVKLILPEIRTDLIESYNELTSFKPETVNGGMHFNAGLGIGAEKQLMSFLKDNIGGEATGALYGLLMDPEMQKAVDNQDGGKVAEILATDAVLGGLVNSGLKTAAKHVPALANVAKNLSTGLNTAMPIAAVSQLQGSTDSRVQEFRNQESLETQDPQAIERSHFVPQQYGKQGPEITPQGEVITEPKPLIGEELIQRGIKMFAGGMHYMRGLQLGI